MSHNSVGIDWQHSSAAVQIAGCTWFDTKEGVHKAKVPKNRCDLPREHRLYSAIGSKCPCFKEFETAVVQIEKFVSAKAE